MSQKHFQVKQGLRIYAVTADPIDAQEGDIIFRSDLTPPRFRTYRNSSWADLHDSGFITNIATNDNTSGTTITLAAPTSPFVRLTNAALVSVNGIPAGQPGQTVIFSNTTGSLVIFNDQTGTSANQIITGNNKPIKLKNGGTILAIYDGTTAKWRVISGNGSSTGDANELLERVKDRLVESPFEWVNANIFVIDEATKTSSATSTYDVANDVYKFTAPAQNYVSIQALDPEFLTEQKDVDSVELMAFWDIAGLDTNATYEVSRNGGFNWSTMTLSRIGTTSDTFRGILTFPQDTSWLLLHEWPVSQATAYREMNATTLQAIGQKFTVLTSEVAQQAILYINKVGSPVGTTKVQLVKDDGTGKPSTNVIDVLAEAQVLNSSLASGDNALTLSWGSNMLLPGSYHFVIITDATYKAGFTAGVNSVRARVDSTAPIGTFSINELISGVWTANATQTLIHTINGRGLDLRVRVTSSASNVSLRGYSVFYGRQDQVQTGVKNREVQQFDGTVNNYNTFTLTNFLPDPDLLKVYHVETGQVYLYGNNGFSLNGLQVVFPANTFNGLGTVTLVFDQLVGTSFDNSDGNAALLAANFLGSTNPNIDRSQNGRGIFLRRPDGTLREITIDNNDNIVVYSI